MSDFGPVSFGDTIEVQCICVGPGGVTYSNSVFIEPDCDPDACQIVTHPVSIDGQIGDPMMLTVTATGPVQWETASTGAGPWTPATPPTTITATNVGSLWRACCTDPAGVTGLRSVFDPSLGSDQCWQLETSDPQESAVVAVGQGLFEAGGFVDTNGTHYARVRCMIPENYGGHTASGSWSLSATVELPSDFYVQQESFVRLLGTDNFTVASGGDEWRVGLAVFSDGSLHLVSDHENNGLLDLWAGSQTDLPAGGTHDVAIQFTPSSVGAGSWALIINGSVVGAASNTVTVPATVPAGEQTVSRVYAGLDGASGQDTNRLAVAVNEVVFDDPTYEAAVSAVACSNIVTITDSTMTRTTGSPTSSNGASSMHLWWEYPGGFPPLCEVCATLEIPDWPVTPELYFWALQVFFDDANGGVSAAHMGLQYSPAYPNNGAVNWGGYSQSDGSILSGGSLTNPSAQNNPNTMNYLWQPGRKYRYRVYESPVVNIPKAWRAEITDLTTGVTTIIRDIYAGGTHMAAPLVWTESFGDCDDPAVCAQWSDLEGTVCGTGAIVTPNAVTAEYQTYAAGGCTNTNSELVAPGVVEQCTNTSPRTTPPGTIIQL